MLAHSSRPFPDLAYPAPAPFFLLHARPRSFQDPIPAAAAVDANANADAAFDFTADHTAVDSPSDLSDDYYAPPPQGTHQRRSPEQPSASPAQSASFHYVPRPDIPAAMYPHSQPSQHDDPAHYYTTEEQRQQQQQQQQDPYVQHPQSHSRRSPPALLPGASGSAGDDPDAPYSASPLSSPSDSFGGALLPGASQRAPQHFLYPPMSAPHHAPPFPSYTNELRYPFTPTLDRRASEPVLGARGALASLAHSQQHAQDAFAYGGAPGTPSPRPSSASYGYPYYTQQQQQQRAQAQIAGLDAYGHAQGWGVAKHEEGGEPLPPLSPVYAGSAASGSDASGAGPSPRQSPLKPGMGTPHQQKQHPSGAGSRNSKTYSFVSLPGNAVKKRPRRRYDEIERLYQCSWPNCTKAYGTLNHLNAHVTMQKHGPKRSPGEFKELRKQWRQAKKEMDDQERERDREREAQLRVGLRDVQAHHMPHHAHPQHPSALHPLANAHAFDRTRRRLSLGPYPDPHMGYGAPPDLGYALAGPGVGMGAYPLSPHDLPRYAQDEEMHEMYRQSPAVPHPHPQTPAQAHNPGQSQSQGQGQAPAPGHDLLSGGASAWPQSDLRSGGVSLAAATRPMQPFYGQLQAQTTLSALSAAPSATFPSLGSSVLPQPPSPTELHALHQQHQQQHQARAPPQLHAPRGGLPPDSTLLTAVPAFAMEEDREREREREYERGARMRREYEDYQ